MSSAGIIDLDSHPHPHVTVEDLARYWGVSTRTVYRDIDKGALKVLRLPGGNIRIRTKDAREYGKPSR